MTILFLPFPSDLMTDITVPVRTYDDRLKASVVGSSACFTLRLWQPMLWLLLEALPSCPRTLVSYKAIYSEIQTSLQLVSMLLTRFSLVVAFCL